MGTKVKGFFKGLKNISNIFDEEKEEQEIQIGMPTDVKHVAHIGADGPKEESPSWMKDFDSGHNESGSLDVDLVESQGTKNHRATRSEELNRELSDMPKPPKQRHRSMDATLDPDSDSQGTDSSSSTKPKRTRRHRLRRRSQEKGDEESPDTKVPDVPKKRTRRRKLRERDDDGSTKSMDSQSSNN